MNLDERAITQALADIDGSVPVDLLARVRDGGRRRVRRRRGVVGAGVVAAGAIAVPVGLAATSGSGSSVAQTEQQNVYPGLYAAPPAPGTDCGAASGAVAAAAAYPELLLLPPAGQ